MRTAKRCGKIQPARALSFVMLRLPLHSPVTSHHSPVQQSLPISRFHREPNRTIGEEQIPTTLGKSRCAYCQLPPIRPDASHRLTYLMPTSSPPPPFTFKPIRQDPLFCYLVSGSCWCYSCRSLSLCQFHYIGWAKRKMRKGYVCVWSVSVSVCTVNGGRQPNGLTSADSLCRYFSNFQLGFYFLGPWGCCYRCYRCSRSN